MARSLLSISTVSFLLLFLISALPVLASGVFVSVELASQLPLVARVGETYLWTISNSTFGRCSDALNLSTSSLPPWLSFDPDSTTFYGKPTADDGNSSGIDVTVIARGCGSSASSSFNLFLTSNPAPTLNTPVASQFRLPNPSLSSVFEINATSALATQNPALRIPPKWSFSIGFQGNTFTSSNRLYYALLQADGSPIPSWMRYNSQEFTLGGVTPLRESVPIPSAYNLVLHASDEEGTTALQQRFDIILADHDVSLSRAVLPTINITAGTPFSLALNSSLDFSGVLVDGEPFQPEYLADLLVDTSCCAWLSYDQKTRHLSGNSASDSQNDEPVLLVKLVTVFNETLQTNVSMALVPSYFSTDTIPPIVVGGNGHLQFDLRPYFSNTSDSNDVELSASYDPSEAGDVMSFGGQTGLLNGTIPSNFSKKPINVTFAAYSRTTHSTSHTSVSVTLSPSNHKSEDFDGSGHHGGLSGPAHARLVLGLSIAFGVIGGMLGLGILLALFRRCARVEDTALGGQMGQQAWSEKDRKWYGVEEGKGYGYSEKLPAHTRSPLNYGNLGLHRVLERSHSDLPSNLTSAGMQSPGVMSKREFITRIRETVRTVSDKYARSRRAPQAINLNRPVIGKPILITSAPVSGSPPDPFSDLNSGPGSSFLTRTSSSSSDDGSIPQRRTDCLTRPPPVVHFEDSRNGSRDSIASVVAHATEAVVQTASRASIRNAMSDHHEPLPSPLAIRPRLVPFTSATRVPVPSMSVTSPDSPESSFEGPQRVASQKAFVEKQARTPFSGVKKSGSGDELAIGIHYVHALGAENPVNTAGSTLTVSTNVRSSFSSLESSHDGHQTGEIEAVKMVARAGERFKFRIALEATSPGSYGGSRSLQARLVSGQKLPKFLHVDLNLRRGSGAVAFYGVPSAADIGEFDAGVYDGDVCVGRLYLEIIGRG
ncbi:uncharacterized protein ARMOST_06815 [Armillaria ostoyae]|uniref:Dystroglycan-type cadherin-like domain-containing protein n=1 Tax=Armillaria ostoyae TaxID=47428 RepID=A0A284R431_ARMOS|nr:uncharacterized protein ARMOST_06815 [Armillaria ostoyae]